MYQSKLNLKETQNAIKIIKDTFEDQLSNALNLNRVTAPIIVDAKTKINDDLGLKNSALNFFVESLNSNIEIVQSLAKWKRMALCNYGYSTYEGIYTDMNAIRPLDPLDQTHSLYVDQWDWELIINESDRTIKFLESIVTKIILALKTTQLKLKEHYPILNQQINQTVHFIEAEALYYKYPNLSTKEREREITKQYKTVFILKIGGMFAGNQKHDNRAADYDDWNLNGDLLIWSDVLDDAVEISSMGIRVDAKSLRFQLEHSDFKNDQLSDYHQLVINNKLPLTIGGGIGQSRICMILLEKLHIAEVQSSVWDRKQNEFFSKNNVKIL